MTGIATRAAIPSGASRFTPQPPLVKQSRDVIDAPRGRDSGHRPFVPRRTPHEPGSHSGGIPCHQISSGARRRIAPDSRSTSSSDALSHFRHRRASTRRPPRPWPLPRRRRCAAYRGLPAARTQIVQGRLQLFRLAGEQIGDQEEETTAGATMGVGPNRWRQRGSAHRLQALQVPQDGDDLGPALHRTRVCPVLRRRHDRHRSNPQSAIYASAPVRHLAAVNFVGRSSLPRQSIDAAIEQEMDR